MSLVHALASTITIQTLSTASTVAIAAIAPMVAQSLGVETSLMGTYVLLVYLGAAVSALVGGTMVARYGGIHVSQVCLILSAIGLLLMLTGVLWVMAIGALLIGISYGPVTPASTDILAHNGHPRHMGLIFSLKQSAVPFGSALTGMVIPSFALWADDWRAGPLLTAGLCLLVVLLVMIRRSQLDDHTDPNAKFNLTSILSSLRMVVSHRPLRCLLAVAFIYGGTQLALINLLVSYLVEDVQFSLVFAGLALSSMSLGGVCGRLFWGIVADWLRVGQKIFIFFGLVMTGFLILLGFFSSEMPTLLVLVLTFCMGATAIGWSGVHLAQLARMAPDGKAAAATGGVLFFGFGGSIFLPPVVALMHSITGHYQSGFWFLAVLCAAVAVMIIIEESNNTQ